MKLKVNYSVAKDAQNYVNGVFRFKYLKHGRKDPSKQLLSGLEEDLQKVILQSKDEKEAYDAILKYLTNHDDGKSTQQAASLQKVWKTIGAQIIANLEFLYQKKFPFPEASAYLTTIPLCPYNYDQRWFFVFAKTYTRSQLAIVKHELSHFMFYHYYPQTKLGLEKEKYELLKESLTFFSNPDEWGKPAEKPLRDLYTSRSFSSLDEVIKAGKGLLVSQAAAVESNPEHNPT